MLALFSDPAYDGMRVALEAVQRDFAHAVTARNDNALTIAGTELRVDQVRRIASIPGDPETWITRHGRRLIGNDTRLGRLTLAYVVGSRRYLTAEGFRDVLARLTRDPERMPASDLAQFVNLVAAEPAHDPAGELPIWLTVAHDLVPDRGRDYFAQDIPGLLTDHDPLHAEIPEQADYADPLRPGATRPREPTLPRYKAYLLDVVADVSGLATDKDRDSAFAAHSDELEAYVRDQLVSPLARGE